MERLVVSVLASLLTIEPALAITPATAEQVLCWHQTAVIGTVLNARSHDCRLTQSSCYQTYVGVSIRVDQVLPQSSSSGTIQQSSRTFQPGDEVRAAFHIRNEMPIKSGDLTIPLNTSDGGAIGFPATGRAITDAEARSQLLGKRLILALTPITTSADANIVAELGEPYVAGAYPASDENWVRGTWISPHCALLKRQ
jgi:hypothetical protein